MKELRKKKYLLLWRLDAQQWKRLEDILVEEASRLEGGEGGYMK
jgi:hypothetical protein